MPKIKHIARFTTPVKLNILQQTNETETTPIRTRHLPEKLRTIVNKRTAEHKALIDLIAIILEESDQPMTALEITRLTEIKLDKKIDQSVMRTHLQELEVLGRVSCRVESTEERKIRANGGKVKSLHANLWWAPAGEVPKRTITEAVPGIILIESQGRKPGVKNKKTESKAKVVNNPPVSQTPVIDYLVNKLVEEKVRSIQEELNNTKEELERLRGKLKILVGDL